MAAVARCAHAVLSQGYGVDADVAYAQAVVSRASLRVYRGGVPLAAMDAQDAAVAFWLEYRAHRTKKKRHLDRVLAWMKGAGTAAREALRARLVAAGGPALVREAASDFGMASHWADHWVG